MIGGNKKRTESSKPRYGSLKRFSLRRASAPLKVRSSCAKAPAARVEKAPASFLALMCLIVALVAGLFVFHLSVRFDGVRLGYETSQARAERARLIVERRELRLELATLKAPTRIEAEAREKLGMEIPDHDRIVLMGKQTKTTLASGGAR